MRALRPVTRSGGSVLKAPQRRRGGTPPRAEPGAYRYPKPCIPCILGHERPRVARPRSCGGNRLREAGAPSSRRLCQSLLGRRGGGTALGGGCRLREAAQEPLPVHPHARKPSVFSPASGNRRVPPSLPMHPHARKTPCLLPTRGRGHGVIS